MTESIQTCRTCTADAVRRRFLIESAELYGRPLAVGLDETTDLDDTAAVLLAFPWMTDAELLEALWALGQVAGTDL